MISQIVNGLGFNQPHQRKKQKASRGSEEEQKQKCTTPSSSENSVWIQNDIYSWAKTTDEKKKIQMLCTWKLPPFLLKKGG